MRKHIRDQIVELITTVWDGINYAENSESDDKVDVLNRCFGGVDFIDSLLDKNLSKERYLNYQQSISEVKAIINYLDSNLGNDEFMQLLNKHLQSIVDDLLFEPEIKLEVLFLPYKASMWTSLESIWRAAKSDPQCNAHVVPIPFSELDANNSKRRECYEGGEFPSDVPIVKYTNYNISLMKPDIIFIHNPYDGINNLTRISEEYYSSNLIKYTEMLVYSPYFTTYIYCHFKEERCLLPGIIIADKVILESESLKEKYVLCGHQGSKLLAMGSPKMDAVIKNIKNPPPLPEEWIRKVSGRPVFLLSTTLSFFSVLHTEYDNIAPIDKIVCIFDCLQKHNCVLLWRVHPLEDAFILKHLPELYSKYKNILKLVNDSDIGIIDNYADYRYAFSIADAMFSSHSSMVNEFMATKKQIFIIQGFGIKPATGDLVFNKVLQRNWMVEDLYINVNNFIDEVLKGEDELYDTRMDLMKKTFINLEEGDSGAKIYDLLKDEVLNTISRMA